MKLMHITILLILTWLLSSCGQTGPLYLPPAQAQKPQARQQTKPQSKPASQAQPTTKPQPATSVFGF